MKEIRNVKNTLRLIHNDDNLLEEDRVTFVELYQLLELELCDVLKIANEMSGNDVEFNNDVRGRYKSIERFAERYNL